MAATFFDTLRNIRDGASLSEAQDMMTDLVEQVRATGRPGKLSLTVVQHRPAAADGTTGKA